MAAKLNEGDVIEGIFTIALALYIAAFGYDFTNNGAPRKVIDQISKWDRKYKRVTK